MRRITEFVALLDKEQKEHIAKTYANLGEDYTGARMINGRVYTKVDIKSGCQWGARYMVDIKTGVIYGTKGYGKVHKGHTYGTLDTIDEWDWHGYTAVKKC